MAAVDVPGELTVGASGRRVGCYVTGVIYVDMPVESSEDVASVLAGCASSRLAELGGVSICLSAVRVE